MLPEGILLKKMGEKEECYAAKNTRFFHTEKVAANEKG